MNDPVVGIIGLIMIIAVIGYVCSKLDSNDSSYTPRRNYSNNTHLYDDENYYNWDDSWDDKWLHQGKYADKDDVPEYTDYDPSWDEHFRD